MNLLIVLKALQRPIHIFLGLLPASIVSLRRYSIRHVLLLCENKATANILKRAGLYHYYPRDLVENMNLIGGKIIA